MVENFVLVEEEYLVVVVVDKIEELGFVVGKKGRN